MRFEVMAHLLRVSRRKLPIFSSAGPCRGSCTGKHYKVPDGALANPERFQSL
mgnify:CR=1 FL=1